MVLRDSEIPAFFGQRPMSQKRRDLEVIANGNSEKLLAEIRAASPEQVPATPASG